MLRCLVHIRLQIHRHYLIFCHSQPSAYPKAYQAICRLQVQLGIITSTNALLLPWISFYLNSPGLFSLAYRVQVRYHLSWKHFPDLIYLERQYLLWVCLKLCAAPLKALSSAAICSLISKPPSNPKAIWDKDHSLSLIAQYLTHSKCFKRTIC